MAGMKLAAGIVHRESLWLHMLSKSQDFVQGRECREGRTKKGGEAGVQMVVSRLFWCQLKSPSEFKAFAGTLS